MQVQPRLLFVLASDGLIPSVLATTDEQKVLRTATIVSGAIVVVVAIAAPFAALDDFISAGVLLCFAVTNSCAIVIRRWGGICHGTGGGGGGGEGVRAVTGERGRSVSSERTDGPGSLSASSREAPMVLWFSRPWGRGKVVFGRLWALNSLVFAILVHATCFFSPWFWEPIDGVPVCVRRLRCVPGDTLEATGVLLAKMRR